MRAIEFEATAAPKCCNGARSRRRSAADGPDSDRCLRGERQSRSTGRSGRAAWRAPLPLTFPATPVATARASCERWAGRRSGAGRAAGRILGGRADRAPGSIRSRCREERGGLVPDGISLTEAAALPLAGTSAWIPLVDIAQTGPGMRVLIHAGAGGVGSLGIQIARAPRCACDRDSDPNAMSISCAHWGRTK